jgi:hypothetical protein
MIDGGEFVLKEDARGRAEAVARPAVAAAPATA